MWNNDLEQNFRTLSCNKEVQRWDYKNNVGVIVPKSGLWRHFSPKEGKMRRNLSARNAYRVQGYEELQWNEFCQDGKRSRRMGYQPWASVFWKGPEKPSREGAALLVTEGQEVRDPLRTRLSLTSETWSSVFKEKHNSGEQRYSKTSRSCPQLFSPLGHRQLPKPTWQVVIGAGGGRWSPGRSGTQSWGPTKGTPCEDWDAAGTSDQWENWWARQESSRGFFNTDQWRSSHTNEDRVPLVKSGHHCLGWGGAGASATCYRSHPARLEGCWRRNQEDHLILFLYLRLCIIHLIYSNNNGYHLLNT